jgi:hypothetical protein
MSRVTMNPGRDLHKPLVEIPDDATRWQRLALQVLRAYIGGIFALALLRGLVVVCALVVILLLAR